MTDTMMSPVNLPSDDDYLGTNDMIFALLKAMICAVTFAALWLVTIFGGSPWWLLPAMTVSAGLAGAAWGWFKPVR